MGSLAGRAPIPFQAHYSASKAALEALTLALRLEVAPSASACRWSSRGTSARFNDDRTGAPRGSPYADRLRVRGRHPRLAAQGPGPRDRGRVIHRALTDRRPRVRYTVGPDSRLVPLGRRFPAGFPLPRADPLPLQGARRPGLEDGLAQHLLDGRDTGLDLLNRRRVCACVNMPSSTALRLISQSTRAGEQPGSGRGGSGISPSPRRAPPDPCSPCRCRYGNPDHL